MKKILINIPVPLWRRARVKAARQDRSTAALIREAVALYLANPPKGERAA